MKTMTECTTCREQMADLLLEPGFMERQPALRAHLDACTACAAELEDLRGTMAVLDAWQAPEVSPFFDTRLRARLKEEAETPVSVWQRVQMWWQNSTSRSFRPALAGALATMLVVGGASVISSRTPWMRTAQAPHTSATVNDLKIIDTNAQALQQMDQLLADDSSQDEDNGPTT